MRGAAGALFFLGVVQLGLAVASCTPSCCAQERELRDRVEQLERLLDRCEVLARSSSARARACSRSDLPKTPGKTGGRSAELTPLQAAHN